MFDGSSSVRPAIDPISRYVPVYEIFMHCLDTFYEASFQIDDETGTSLSGTRRRGASREEICKTFFGLRSRLPFSLCLSATFIFASE